MDRIKRRNVKKRFKLTLGEHILSLPYRLLRKFRSSVEKFERYQMVKRCGAVGDYLYIWGTIKGFNKNVKLGDHVSLNGIQIIGRGEINIGRYFHGGQNITIITDNHNYDSDIAIPYDDVRLSGSVTIGDFVWVGHDVTILGGVTIGEGVVIGAGAVIAKDIPPYAIVVGNPGRIIKFRDIEKFQLLKSKGSFF